MKKEQGFTLIELLIVVAIIAIIAAIAIPNLLDARRAANESSAQATLRSISSAQYSYMADTNRFATLATLVSRGILDNRFDLGAGSGIINGYEITILPAALTNTNIPTGLEAFVAGEAGYATTPISGSAGRYHYALLSDLVIRFNTSTPNCPASYGTGTTCAGMAVGGGTSN